jgi:FK506-binding protein 2
MSEGTQFKGPVQPAGTPRYPLLFVTSNSGLFSVKIFHWDLEPISTTQHTSHTMRLTSIVSAFALLFSAASALDKPLDIQVTKAVECTRKTKSGKRHQRQSTRKHTDKKPPGDKVNVHYRGTLDADGSEFDASYNRGQPLSFHVGKGQVIKGWDQGLLDMCPGEKRTLTIQPDWGYGARGMGPIPANSVLKFETELVSIAGVEPEAAREL